MINLEDNLFFFVPPWDADPVLHDLGGHLGCQVEDGVLVWLDRHSGVNHKDKRGVQDLSITSTLPCSS